MAVNIQFDPTDPAFRADPYPFYHRLRAADPIHWAQPGFWLITRYLDAMAILQDSRFGHPGQRTAEYTDYLIQQGRLSPVEFLLNYWMLSKNPPDHTRLRGLVNKAFSPRVIEGLRPRIQAIVDGLLDAVYAKGSMDIVADLAYPLPVAVIAELLGVPVADREHVKRWSDDLIGVIDIMPDAKKISQGNIAIQKFLDYFHDLIIERRANPQDDLMSALIAAEEEGTQLNERELLANCILLLVAGHETTTNLIGNGMLALLRHPDELEKLRANPALMRDASEELLRYDSPVKFFGRAALEDVTIGGKMIRKRQTLYILPGAINRDPAQFPDPDRLDITRTDNRHLAFGYGIHFCLGASLARIEGQIAIGTLIRRMQSLALETESVKWQDSIAVRGLKSLSVTFGPRQ